MNSMEVSLPLKSSDGTGEAHRTMSIDQFVPRTQNSIDNIGFLFGAGTSFEAGYPLIAGLTRQVIDALNVDQRALLDQILERSGRAYDAAAAAPNIEEVADQITEYHTNSNAPAAGELINTIRSAVTDAITAVESPDISHHVAFLEKLKRRSFSRPTRVFIFTTNYDLLFEQAAAEVGVRIVNGFSGAIHRHFSEKEFALQYGRTMGGRFTPDPSLSVNLIKLHGSVSWALAAGCVTEMDPIRIDPAAQRCMVLPRRTKITETLSHPYDRLFSVCAGVLGSQCKYLVSAGFSFGDQHINDTLLLPKIESGGISLTNFCLNEPAGVSGVRERPNVTHICSDQKIVGGQSTADQSDLWKFSEFVKLF